MCTSGNNSDMLYLPEEITRDILKRLPVKSLIRFQCVCKHWNNLIENPSFIYQHLQHSNIQNPSSFLLVTFDGFMGLSYFPLCLCLLDCDLRFREFPELKLIGSLDRVRIVGSCNGLLLVETKDYDTSPNPLSLWNPATASVGPIPRTTSNCSRYNYFITGFGFTKVDNDYKIVSIYAGYDDFIKEVEVFSLNRGSWEKVYIGNIKQVKLDKGTITVGGAMFWTGTDFGVWKRGGDDAKKVIVSFDMVNEYFTLIPRPDSSYDAKDKLTIYENKPAMLRVTGEDGHIVELWVLDESSRPCFKSWSWTKRYIGNPFLKTDPLAVWSNNIVCKRLEGIVLSLMNLTNKEVKKFVINSDRVVNVPYYYVESLVSVGNNNYKGE